MSKFLYLILALLLLESCAFQVIYKDEFDDKSMAHQLASIKIKKERNQLAQNLKNNVSDVFNPDFIVTEPKYFLEMTLTSNIALTYTNASGGSGRNKVTLKVHYILKNIKTAQKISEGNTEAYDSYDVSSNRYATYTAEEYIKENLTKVIAQNIRNSIVNDLVEENRECEENKNNKEYKCLLE